MTLSQIKSGEYFVFNDMRHNGRTCKGVGKTKTICRQKRTAYIINGEREYKYSDPDSIVKRIHFGL